VKGQHLSWLGQQPGVVQQTVLLACHLRLLLSDKGWHVMRTSLTAVR
jgi:hypothetical protein